jgi:hypothetical protein
MTVDLNLTVEEVNSLLHVLGELPTRMNAYPLLMKIKEQAEAQIPKEQSE